MRVNELFIYILLLLYVCMCSTKSLSPEAMINWTVMMSHMDGNDSGLSLFLYICCCCYTIDVHLDQLRV